MSVQAFLITLVGVAWLSCFGNVLLSQDEGVTDSEQVVNVRPIVGRLVHQ